MRTKGNRTFRSVAKEEFRKVPYIDHIPSDGRIVFIQPYLDREDKTWKTFVPWANKLTLLFAEPIESCYYAQSVIDKLNDIYLRIIDTIVQHYSFDSVVKTSIRIINDIINSAVVLEKYFVFLDRYRNLGNPSVRNLVTTDLEYFFGNVRSLYDLLQSVISDLWKRVAKRELPDSFASMVEQEEQELMDKYCLPKPLIKYYSESKDFFLKCRSIRDSIYHRGSYTFEVATQTVFCCDDGFALKNADPIFDNPLVSKFDIWPKEKIKENGLVSILALIAYINKKLLENTDKLSQALVESIRPPPPISDTHKLFLRSPYIHHLLKSDEYIKKQWIP